ncbi:MAG: enoyl-CoA hydratase/isomerase family protein [Deltaproteobacteria bacterium]|nr:enoyl-CoA hydratase/isomerase family protein [Deltaproteobacteria bacterium]
MNLETVLYDVRDCIAKITMNRADKRNALNHALLRDLDSAFDEAEKDKTVRVVILAAAGKAFCSGYDLKGSPYITIPEGRKEWTRGSALEALRGISDRYRRILYFPKPVIAQVHGHCVAAGCYLQMCCDVSIAAEDAVLGHPATRGGGVTSMPLWITYLGVRKAKELLMTSRLISGKEAERIGLVNKAVPPDRLVDEVWQMAKEMAEVPPEGMTMLKEAMSTHLQILGMDALFSYHRQLNALGRLGKDDDD